MAFSKARRLANLMSTASDTVPASKVNTVLADDAVTTAKIADDAITTALIADGSITAAKLAADATIAKLSSAPSVGSEGSLYYNTTTDKLYLSNGTVWQPIDTNAPPVPTGGTITIPTQAGVSTFSYNLGLNFTDELPDAELTYTLQSGTLPAGAVLPTAGNTALTGTATNTATTTYNFVIRATDAKAAFATQAYTQVITNTLPTATGGTVTIATQAGLTTFSYNLGLNFSDAQDADAALTYTLASGTLPAGAVLPTSGNSALTGTATNQATATYNFVIRATNTGGGAVTQAYTQTVIGVLVATGGTITTYGSYKVHTFTSSGTFAVSNGGSVDVLVVAGGGGGGAWVPSGGGAGGLITSTMSVAANSFSIVIGAGGSREVNPGGYGGMPAVTKGANTTALGVTTLGGGAGLSYDRTGIDPNGGSGAGAVEVASSVAANTPGTGTAGQGHRGGYARVQNTNPYPTGGGGGAGAVGGTAPNASTSGSGGAGSANNYRTGSNIYYAGGGAGGCHGSGTSGTGGTGGGGYGTSSSTVPGGSGSDNTGGGGGGGGNTGGSASYGGNGGSGIVIIRYAV